MGAQKKLGRVSARPFGPNQPAPRLATARLGLTPASPASEPRPRVPVPAEDRSPPPDDEDLLPPCSPLPPLPPPRRSLRPMREPLLLRPPPPPSWSRRLLPLPSTSSSTAAAAVPGAPAAAEEEPLVVSDPRCPRSVRPDDEMESSSPISCSTDEARFGGRGRGVCTQSRVTTFETQPAKPWHSARCMQTLKV